MKKIYTKTGDKGETGLFSGDRISKNSKRIDSYGTIDELNSYIGLTITEVRDEGVKKLLKNIQNKLFIVGSDLATPDTEKKENPIIKRTPEKFHLEIEKEIDIYETQLEELKNFILPGGTKSAALMHICRTISRRAERKVVALNETENINENVIIFLNRLSDLFFVLSRYENSVAGIPDVIWEKD